MAWKMVLMSLHFRILIPTPQYDTPQLHGPNYVEIPYKKAWFRLGGV